MPYPLARLTVLPLLRRRITNVSGAEYVPRLGPFIAVANHSSWLDSAYLASALYRLTGNKMYFFAASKKHRWLGGLPIDKSNPSAVLASAEEKIKDGHPIIIFPEGNSDPSPSLRPGKTGAARLALTTRVPLLPVGIVGTGQYSMYTSLVHFFLWRPRIKINFAAPLQLNRYYDRPWDEPLLRQVTNDIMQAISRLSGKPMAHA